MGVNNGIAYPRILQSNSLKAAFVKCLPLSRIAIISGLRSGPLPHYGVLCISIQESSAF